FLQHFNRLQNTLQVLDANAQTGDVKPVLVEKDDTWVDLELPSMRWLDGERRFLWISERDGWRHAYTVSKDGRDVKKIITGDFDVISVQAVDEAGGRAFFLSFPPQVTQPYSFTPPPPRNRP